MRVNYHHVYVVSSQTEHLKIIVDYDPSGVEHDTVRSRACAHALSCALAKAAVRVMRSHALSCDAKSSGPCGRLLNFEGGESEMSD